MPIIIIQPPNESEPFLNSGIRLYNDMLNDIKLCREKGMDNETTIQCCFDIANNYKAKLAEEAVGVEFQNRENEIFYFKKLKPLFAAEAEFQGYCYYASIFKRTPEGGYPLEVELFYGRELKRMERFSREQKQLYEYVYVGGTDKDVEWFTGLDEDKQVSRYDRQMGTYLAIKKYEDYIKKELNRLNRVAEKKSDGD